MPGSPLKRQRKTGAVDPATGELVAFPFLPRVTGADKPPGWNRWSAAEKIEHLLGMSLDRCYEILSWPIDDLDPFRPFGTDAGVARCLHDRRQGVPRW